MLKKILGIAGLIFSGVNLGAISCANPFYLIIMVLLSATNEDIGFFVATAIISAIIAGVIAYIYAYKKKREHEQASPYVLSFLWSFVAGALLAAIFFFITIGNSAYDIG